jgi:hypothetical protein
VNLGNQPELQYPMDTVIELLDVYRDGAGSVAVGDLTWSYASSVPGSAPGELIGGGTSFSLLLDPQTGSGLVGAPGSAAGIPEPSTFVLGVLGLFGLACVGWRRCRTGSAPD